MPEALAAELADIMSATLGQPVRITGMHRLTGGTSHDSWAFEAETPDTKHALIIRRDFSSQRLDLALNTEIALLRQLYDAGLPMPKPVASGSDYIISERLPGGDVRKQMARGVRQPAALGETLIKLQVQLHQYNWKAQLNGTLKPRDEVQHWSALALAGVRGADPLLAATIAWLKRHAPENTPMCLVHGDFKANNLVAGDAGRIAIIDWELAHIGDPLEDVAWTMLWQTPHDLVAGMLSPEAYLDIYEKHMSASIDPHRLAYWQLFVLMKLMAVFFQSMQLHGSTGHPRPSHLMLGRAIPWLHQQMAERLRAASALENAA